MLKSESKPSGLKRDAWMEPPSAFDVEHVPRRREPEREPPRTHSLKADFELEIHERELNKHHLQDIQDRDKERDEVVDQPAQHEVDYVFGDGGSQWRMAKLKNVYRKAKESGQALDEVAMNQYGDLRSFDDAREEEIELDRRETYGEGYVGKEKPSGELFQERKLDLGVRRSEKPEEPGVDDDEARIQEVDEQAHTNVTMDQTALNRLKAQMMKAKLRGSADAAKLEAEYNNAAAGFAPGMDSEVVLGAVHSKMLVGGTRGEVKSIDNKRGRERGLVEENEDMSIEDMVREERRTRGQAGGEGKRFAERIAKDGKFDVS